MKKQSGKTFKDLLTLDRNMPADNPLKLTTEVRLELTIAILKSYKKQVKNVGLVHRDIKPANFFVDMSGDKPLVHFIDYGLAKAEGYDDRKETTGTLGYASPEAFRTDMQTTTASDIFGLGITLSSLWPQQQILALKHHKQASVLQILLTSMIHDCPNFRPSIDRVTERMQRIFDAVKEKKETEQLILKKVKQKLQKTIAREIKSNKNNLK